MLYSGQSQPRMIHRNQYPSSHGHGSFRPTRQISSNPPLLPSVRGNDYTRLDDRPQGPHSGVGYQHRPRGQPQQGYHPQSPLVPIQNVFEIGLSYPQNYVAIQFTEQPLANQPNLYQDQPLGHLQQGFMQSTVYDSVNVSQELYRALIQDPPYQLCVMSTQDWYSSSKRGRERLESKREQYGGSERGIEREIRPVLSLPSEDNFTDNIFATADRAKLKEKPSGKKFHHPAKVANVGTNESVFTFLL
uniref:Uncharacterized protein n=1 Tax=Moniliophthora roreri TaxID=221103 RepID=A0A0W0F4E2_MONRR